MTEPTDDLVTAYRQGVDDWYDPEKTTEDLYPTAHENGLRAVAQHYDRAAARRVLDDVDSLLGMANGDWDDLVSRLEKMREGLK